MRKFLLFIDEKIQNISISKWGPWIIFGTAILTRSIGAYLGGVHSDDQDHSYVGMALAYLSGKGLSLPSDFGPVYSFLPPGMAMLHVIFIRLFGGDLLPVRIIFILMSAVANVAMFFIGKRLYENKFAWLAAMWWAVYPPQWFWASRINAQPYATNMLLFCLFFLYRGWEKRNFLLAFVIGVLWVTITLCRGEYVFGIGVLILASFLYFSSRREALLFGSLLLAGWMLAFAPWVIRNYRIHHRFILIATNDGQNFWKSYNPAYQFSGYDIPFPPELQERLMKAGSEVARADLLKAEALRFILENPKLAIRNVVGNLLNFWRPWLSPLAVSRTQNIVYVFSYLPLFLFFLVALFKIPWREPPWAVIGGILLYKCLIHIPFYVIVRYREAVMPLIALMAVYGLRHFWQKALLQRSHV